MINFLYFTLTNRKKKTERRACSVGGRGLTGSKLEKRDGVALCKKEKIPHSSIRGGAALIRDV